MKDKIPFADSGEFSGMGAPAANAEETDTGAAGEAGGETPADADRETAGKPDAAKEVRETEARPDEKETRDNGKEAKEPEEKKDPLDEIITDFAKVDLGLGDAPVDAAVMEAFGRQCVALKLTPRQAKGLCEFQLQAIEDARKRLTDESRRELAREWGKDADENQREIQSLVKRVDAALGNDDFSQALEASGVTCYAEFARGLLALVKMTGEDSLGPTGSGASASKPETALEGLQDVFAKARGK